MTVESLYSDGNVGTGIAVVSPSNANGDQDGNFASAEFNNRNDEWEFTMDNTSLSDSQIANATSIIMKLRFYVTGDWPPSDEMELRVWDDSASTWVRLERFQIGDAPSSDPGDYVENYDITSLMATAAELNAVKFRFKPSNFIDDKVIYVDAIRVQTTYPTTIKDIISGIARVKDFNIKDTVSGFANIMGSVKPVTEFGDVVDQFSDHRQTFTGHIRSNLIDNEGYISEPYSTSTFQGVLLPISHFNFLGHGFELKGDMFLYVSTDQTGWLDLDIGDMITDPDSITWKVVDWRDYEDHGVARIYGLERDVK